ncbi:Proton pump-interactor 1-like protein [Drosera capensis]
MTAESDVGVDSCKVKADEKCGFDVDFVPEMVVSSDVGNHGVKEENSVGNEDKDFSSDVGKKGGGGGVDGSEELGVKKEECSVSDQLVVESDNGKEVGADRVEDGELAKENLVEIESEDDIKGDIGEAKISECADSEIDRGEDGFCDNVDQGESGMETVTVDETKTGVNADVVDFVVENGCNEDVDAGESEMKNDIVDEMGNMVKDDANGKKSVTDNKMDGEMDIGVDVEAADSGIENGCFDHGYDAKSRTKTVTEDDKEAGFGAEVGDSIVQNGFKDNINDGGSRTETVEMNDEDAGIIDEVEHSGGYAKISESAIKTVFLDSAESRIEGEAADSMMENNHPAVVLGSEFSDGLVPVSDVVSAIEVNDTGSPSSAANVSSNLLQSEVKPQAGETTTESGVGYHCGVEDGVNDEEPVLEDRGASDVANETEVGCSGNLQTVRPHVVEVEHKELDVGKQGSVNSLVDDGVSQSFVADDNISSLHNETETIAGESKEPEPVTAVQSPLIKDEEAHFDDKEALPQVEEVDSQSELALGVGSRQLQLLGDDPTIQSQDGETPEELTSGVNRCEENSAMGIQSQFAQEPAVCCEDMVDERGRTDTDPEVAEFQESFLRVYKNSDEVEGVDDAGEASTDLVNDDACQMTEISFGTVRCLIPSSAWDESCVSKSEGMGSNRVASPSLEEKAGGISDSTDKQGYDEAVDAEGISTEEASASSLEGSNIGTQDSQVLNPENSRKPFYYVIRLPRYDDDKLRQQISLAERERDVKTRQRDAVQAECREKEAALKELKNDLQAARLEEKAARDQFRIKKEEADRFQALIDRAWNAITLEDVDSKISQMQFRIEHHTLPLKEERNLIRQINELKQKQRKFSSDKNRVQEDQLALEQKQQIETQLKVLKNKTNAPRQQLSQAEEVSKAAKKELDDEIQSLHQLRSKKRVAEDLQQAAHMNFINLKDKWNRTNRLFHSYMEDKQVAINYAFAGDKEALECHCLSQDERIRGLLNKDDELRNSYIRCNTRSTLRRFGTLDGRSLGPDEESLPLSMIPNDRMDTSIKVDQVASTSNAEQDWAVEPSAAVDKAPQIAMEQKDQTSTARKIRKKGTLAPSKELPKASKRPKSDQEEEKEKHRKEEDDKAKKAQEEEDKGKKAHEEKELAQKAEEEARRKEEEAERLKEQKRLEEKAKADEARERNRKKAEKAQAIAEFKAKKEAEEKEKRKEKRAKKKENRKTALSETVSGSAESEAISHPEASRPEPAIKEIKTRETATVSEKRPRQPSHYAKQNKIRSIPPPPPALRTRKRRWVKQLMWVLVVAVICLALFIIGNSQNSLLYRVLSLGSSYELNSEF